MTDVFLNWSECVCTRSHITGDILCRWPGPFCDCLMQRIDSSYADRAPAEYDLSIEDEILDAEPV